MNGTIIHYTPPLISLDRWDMRLGTSASDPPLEPLPPPSPPSKAYKYPKNTPWELQSFDDKGKSFPKTLWAYLDFDRKRKYMPKKVGGGFRMICFGIWNLSTINAI